MNKFVLRDLRFSLELKITVMRRVSQCRALVGPLGGGVEVRVYYILH